jgi:hypothetical protein
MRGHKWWRCEFSDNARTASETLCLIVLITPFLISCGPSEKERSRIAAVTCAEIEATRNFESAKRVKLINEARGKLDAEPMLRGDTTIRSAVNYDICETLVMSDEEFDAALNVILELQREAAERAAKRKEENRRKLVDWFNSSYTLRARNLYFGELKNEWNYTPLYAFVGEVTVECASEQRCDQLVNISENSYVHLSAGGKDVSMEVGFSRKDDWWDQEPMSRTFCLLDKLNLFDIVRRSEREDEIEEMAYVMNEKGFKFKRINTGRCKHYTYHDFKNFYKLKQGDATMTTELMPLLSIEVVAELSNFIDTVDDIGDTFVSGDTDWFKPTFAVGEVPIEILWAN